MPPPSVQYEDVIFTQRRIRGKLERSVEPAKLVGGELLGENLLTLGVPNLDVERLAGEICCVGLIVARARDPELESYRRSGAIDRPIGDRVDLDLVIRGIVVAVGPDVGEAQMGQPAFGRGGGDEPLEISLRVNHVGGFDLELSSIVGLVCESLGLDSVFVLSRHLHVAPAEEIDARACDALAGARIGDEVVRLAIERFLQDHGIVEPDHDATDVSALHLAR